MTRTERLADAGQADFRSSKLPQIEEHLAAFRRGLPDEVRAQFDALRQRLCA